MVSVSSPAEIIRILRDIQQRSQSDLADTINDGSSVNEWVAVDFRLGNKNYLVSLDESREIFTIPSQITPVPKSQPWVFGIANLRGELLPLFDLNYFLYGQATKQNKRSRILVIKNKDSSLGILLNEVFGLKHFQQKPTAGTNSDSTISPFLTGHVSLRDQQWDIFSFKKLATDPRFLNAAA